MDILNKKIDVSFVYFDKLNVITKISFILTFQAIVK